MGNSLLKPKGTQSDSSTDLICTESQINEVNYILELREPNYKDLGLTEEPTSSDLEKNDDQESKSLVYPSDMLEKTPLGIMEEEIQPSQDIQNTRQENGPGELEDFSSFIKENETPSKLGKKLSDQIQRSNDRIQFLEKTLKESIFCLKSMQEKIIELEMRSMAELGKENSGGQRSTLNEPMQLSKLIKKRSSGLKGDTSERKKKNKNKKDQMGAVRQRLAFENTEEF